MKISLKNRQIPRNGVGDPSFTSLGRTGEPIREGCNLPTSLLEVFTEEEVVELVNRSLYQLEYQSKAHEKRRVERQLLEAPIKEKFYQLYPHTSWARATPEQVQRAMEELRKTS